MRAERKNAQLTAVVEDDLPDDDDGTNYARETLRLHAVSIAVVSQVPEMARAVARELGIG